MRVLIADDNERVLSTTCEFLEMKGFDVVDTCTNGKTAVELYEKFAPDVILLDIIMPRYDGLYAIKHIKKIDPTAKVIVVTGMSSSFFLDRFHQYNPDHILFKPYPGERLVEVLCS